MTDLLLLRHGPTDATINNAPLGKLDLLVNNYGQALWPQVRSELLTLNIQQVLTSNLSRARDYALDLGLPCRILPDLDEQNFGDWDGVPWSEIAGARIFLEDPVNNTPPNGESFNNCTIRVLNATQKALTRNVPTLILAHGGVLRAILAYYLGIPKERILDIAWQPYGLSKLDLYSHQRGVLCYHNRLLPSNKKFGQNINHVD